MLNSLLMTPASFIVVDTPTSAATRLKNDLGSIHPQSKTWLVKFKLLKNRIHGLLPSTGRPNHPNLLFNKTLISQVQTPKHLGVTLAEDACWRPHTSMCLDKARERIGLLPSFKHLIQV